MGMHFKGLDLNLLVALDALLSEKSVTRAAERVFISQPAMSASLQKLRQHLADPLLIRAGRSLELTPRARQLAGSVKDLLFRIHNLVDNEPTFDPVTARRTYRIAMTGYCVEVFGVSLMRYLNRVAPNVSCQIDELSADVLSRVYEGQLDFCITLSERTMLDPGYAEDGSCEQHLFSDRFMLVGDSRNPVLDNAIRYETFCEQPYVEVRFSRDVVGLAEQAVRRHSKRPQTKATVPTFIGAMSMVANTSMLTIVPSRLVALHGEYFGLTAVSAPLQLRDLDEMALWHPRSDADPAHRWMRSAMNEVAAQMLPGLD
jgi:LysR family nod box-dependent transcriptional activator